MFYAIQVTDVRISYCETFACIVILWIACKDLTCKKCIACITMYNNVL